MLSSNNFNKEEIKEIPKYLNGEEIQHSENLKEAKFDTNLALTQMKVSTSFGRDQLTEYAELESSKSKESRKVGLKKMLSKVTPNAMNSFIDYTGLEKYFEMGYSAEDIELIDNMNEEEQRQLISLKTNLDLIKRE